MLINFALAVIILIYASLQTDLNRKCKNKGAVSESESSSLQYVNISMLVLAVLGVAFYGYQLFVPAEHKAKVASYF
jgi:uncharacterized membrane protein YukC